MADAEKRETLTVIIPCLNERDNLAATVRSVLAVSDRLPVDVEVLLIDDGSTDGTPALMKELEAADARCRMKVNPSNLGLGRSVLQALETLDPDSWVTVVPGDNEFIFDSVEAFLAVRDKYDLMVGYLQNPIIRPLRRRMASRLFNVTVNWLYGFSFRNLNGMKMYRAWVFQGIAVESNGHAYVAELLAKAILRKPMLRIGEAPFAARGRATGSSKAVRPWAIVRAVHEVWRGRSSVSDFRRQVIGSGMD